MSSPGSTLHALRMYKHPRWEDFEYELRDEDVEGNSLHWLGDGQTYNDQYNFGDCERPVANAAGPVLTLNGSLGAWYIMESEIDYPPGLA